ncbi:MAG TPA: hypothetical protein DD435_04230 [Cyanobacteria bacterium UBA8530]|nr:hypothetical protein [Cyanobacteria bacterium UBA8530]
MEPLSCVGSLSEGIESALDKCELFGLPFLFVVDPRGLLMGGVSRSDLMAALYGSLRPTRIGGMATLTGVRLTTGSLCGGAGDLSLLLTGVAFGLLNWGIIASLDFLQARIPFSPLGRLSDFSELFAFLLFLFFLRLSPLSGYHAAEHQTVHAIERGEALTPEILALQPREHPRCGTNLVAAFLGISLLLPVADNPLILLVGGVFIFLYWRKAGMLIQHYFTTKPPTETQSLAAIKAGEELLALYRGRPSFRASWPVRIWGMGIAQVLAGLFLVEFARVMLLLCGRISLFHLF